MISPEGTYRPKYLFTASTRFCTCNLLVHPVDVLLHGAHREAQPVRDLLVQQALGQQFEHARTHGH
jgi:hypothetical protein